MGTRLVRLLVESVKSGAEERSLLPGFAFTIHSEELEVWVAGRLADQMGVGGNRLALVLFVEVWCEEAGEGAA